MTDHGLVGAYALDALSEDERADFERHLATCAECTEEVRGLQNMAAELSHTVATPAPQELRADVLSAISRVRPLPPVGTVTHLQERTRSRWAVRLLVAACTLIAVIGAGYGALQHRDAQDARNRISAISRVIEAPDAQSTAGQLSAGSARVYYSKTQGSLVMHAQGLTRLSADKTYQAWLVGVDGKATSLGIFEPDSAGTVTMTAKGNLAAASAVGVTVEPAGGSVSPTGMASIIKL